MSVSKIFFVLGFGLVAAFAAYKAFPALAVHFGMESSRSTIEDKKAAADKQKAVVAAVAPKVKRVLEDVPPNAPRLVKQLRAVVDADDNDIIVIGDRFFAEKTASRIRDNVSKRQTVFTIILPQADLYTLVALYPTLIQTEAEYLVVESIPAYWSGVAYFANPQPSLDLAIAAIGEGPMVTLEPGAGEPDLTLNRDYIPVDVTAMDIEKANTLVFDNYYSFFDAVQDKLIWVTNEELLLQSSPEFQALYYSELVNTAEPIKRIGRVMDIQTAINTIK